MTKYEDIIAKAPDPELTDKMMCASYILARGQAGVPITFEDMMQLVTTRTIEQLRAEADKIKEEKYKK